jgi:septum formation protein
MKDIAVVPVILASQSPRRRDLLTRMGVDFTIVPSDFDEYLDDDRSPDDIATELALGKAMAVAQQHPEAIVIGSDTIVTIDGQQLGKPENDEDAHRILKMLSGKTNYISTGLAVLRLVDNTRLTGVATAAVTFKPYNQAAVAAYVATGDPLDKAGAYAIQSGAAPLIESINGDYDIIMGLPTKLLAEWLQSLGISAKAVEVANPLP